MIGCLNYLWSDNTILKSLHRGVADNFISPHMVTVCFTHKLCETKTHKIIYCILSGLGVAQGCPSVELEEGAEYWETRAYLLTVLSPWTHVDIAERTIDTWMDQKLVILHIFGKLQPHMTLIFLSLIQSVLAFDISNNSLFELIVV